jgi:hypothetical protein
VCFSCVMQGTMCTVSSLGCGLSSNSIHFKLRIIKVIQSVISVYFFNNFFYCFIFNSMKNYYFYFNYSLINVREYRRGNQKRTIQRNWQLRRRTPPTHTHTCVGYHHTQTNTNNVGKTCGLPQTTGGNDT